MALLFIALGLFLIAMTLMGKMQMIMAQVFSATPPSVKAG
jgi:hypothetical protein